MVWFDFFFYLYLNAFFFVKKNTHVFGSATLTMQKSFFLHLIKANFQPESNKHCTKTENKKNSPHKDWKAK